MAPKLNLKEIDWWMDELSEAFYSGRDPKTVGAPEDVFAAWKSVLA